MGYGEYDQRKFVERFIELRRQRFPGEGGRRSSKDQSRRDLDQAVLELEKKRGIKSPRGLSPNTQASWTRAKEPAKPGIDRLFLLADVFGVPLDYLTGATESRGRRAAQGRDARPAHDRGGGSPEEDHS